MPEPPRRKRFQIHLSTAVVMMIAAGGLLGLNLRRQLYFFDGEYKFPAKAETRRRIPVSEILPPDNWRRYTQTDDPGYVIETNPMVIETRTRKEQGRRYGVPLIICDLDSQYNDRYHYVAILVNAGIALTILGGLWTLLEWRIRRGAARKGA